MANTVVFTTEEEVKNAFVNGTLQKEKKYRDIDGVIFTGAELFEIIHNSAYSYDALIDDPLTEIED